jgi:hypothetical protein
VKVEDPLLCAAWDAAYERHRAAEAAAGKWLPLEVARTRPHFVHNVIAHPLLVIWPRAGEWLHPRSKP